MSLDRALLDIICCPVTRSPLELLPERDLFRLNRLIGEHKVKNRDDAVVAEPLEQALVTRDGKLVYPIRDGVPVLLEDQAITMSQLDAA
jgi:uncharacterized protein YbaR (Trm112 family)